MSKKKTLMNVDDIRRLRYRGEKILPEMGHWSGAPKVHEYYDEQAQLVYEISDQDKRWRVIDIETTPPTVSQWISF